MNGRKFPVSKSLINLLQLEKFEDSSNVLMPSFCRVCLNYSKRLKVIADTKLQIVFENLTKSQLIASDGRPESVCYLCHSLLQRCNKFVQASQKSNEFLSKLLRNESEDKLTEDILVKKRIHIEAPFNLAISNISFVSLSDEKDVKKSNIYLVKTEPAEGDAESTKVHNMNVTTPTSYKVKLTEQNPDDPDEDTERPNKEIESHAYKLERKSETEENCNVSDDASQDNSVNKSEMPSEACKEEILEVKFEKNNEYEHKTQPVQHKTVEIELQQLNVKQKPIYMKPLRLKLAGNPERSTLGYQCEYCLKYIKQKAYFKRHIRIHTGECPYTCNKCEESFRDSIALKQHVRNHTGEAYTCNFCSKQFNQRPKLTEHIRTHTGEKPHTCPKCPYSFAHRSSLVRHLRTHTGEKPYMCDKCSKQFTQISNLTKHAKSCKVSKNPYECQHASCPQSQHLVQVAENASPGETPSSKSALGFDVNTALNTSSLRPILSDTSRSTPENAQCPCTCKKLKKEIKPPPN